MDPATIAALLRVLVGFAPEIPELIAGVETAAGLLESGQDPTAEQQASIDAAMEASHAALQAAKQGTE